MAFLGLSILLGSLCVGSFLGIVIDRLPKEESWLVGRSKCNYCHHPLRWFENLPLISWMLQNGRCNHCKGSISFFYPFVELLAALIAAVVLYFYPIDQNPILSLITLVLGWWLLVLAWIDWRHFILPDRLTLPLIPLGLLITWLLYPENLSSSILGILIGYASLWVIARFYKAIQGRDGLGMGDAKLFAVTGAWIGVSGLIPVMLIASFSALFYALIMRIFSKGFAHDEPLSFGAFLCLGFYLMWLTYPSILDNFFL